MLKVIMNLSKHRKILKVNSEKRNQSFKLDLSNQFRQQNDHGYLGWDYYKFSLAVLKILKLKMS